jgi:hypothetical protein
MLAIFVVVNMAPISKYATAGNNLITYISLVNIR